jgi:hypothetical protein
MNEGMMQEALEVASNESFDGRNVMILLPSKAWADGHPMTSELSDVHGAIHVRRTTEHSGLKSVPIDTLILVNAGHPDWDIAGEYYARERLRTSLDPDVIRVGVEE